jgi:putative thioredoxin
VVDGFVGAYPEEVVRQFIGSLAPTDEERTVSRLLAAGDEASLREALDLEPGNEDVVVALAELLVDSDRGEEALALLARIPESDRTRPVAARARIGERPDDDFDEKLAALLDRVKEDEAARQEYLDILELMGPTDPRTSDYRRQLTSRLF